MANTLDLAAYDAKMKTLLEAFEAHPENQPPTPDPTLFFTYDFLRNTHNQLKAIDATKLGAGDPAASEAIKEVTGRNAFSNLLISDTSGRMSAMMGGGGGPVDFGPDIRDKVKALVEGN